MANLLEQASILLTPTAYNDGKMLSVKPNENLSGSELVANGDFSTDSVWVKDANWSIANGKATSTGAGRMFQSIPFLETNIGSKVVVSFDIVDYTSGGVVIQCYGNSSETFTGVGTHTFETVTTNTLNLYINNSGQGNLVGSIDNVSIKVDLSGDFIFTRNSAATRVNAQGLVENVQILSSDLVSNGSFSQEGSELVTNGDFATDSDWVLNDWNISGGLLNASASTGIVFQSNLGLTVGKTYKATLEVSNYVSGAIRFKLGGSSYQNIASTNGVQEFFFTASTTANNILFSVLSAYTGSIDNVSVKEVGQDWNLRDVWVISNGVCSLTSPNSDYLSQSNLFTASKSYKLTFDIIVNSGNLQPQFFDGGFQTIGTYSTSQSVEVYFLATSSGTLYFKPNSFDGSIDNVSVKEITDDTNLPRIDYTDGCGSWLLEPQSTNLIKNSEPTAQESAANGITYESFDWSVGFTNCIKFTNINNSYWYGGTVLPETQYTLSVFIIMDDLSQPQAGLGASNDFYMPIGNASTTSYSYQDFGNNVWRVKGTQTSSAINLNNSGIRKLSNSSKGFRVVGWQLEEGSFATSYIPTSGAISTRLRDLSGNSGNASLINSTEGVLYFEGKMMENAPVSYVSISDGTGSVNNNLNIRFTPSTNTVWWRVQVGGSASVSIIVGLSDMFSNTKLALKWKENDFSLWENGNKISFDTLGSVFPLNTLNTIDLHQANGLSSFNSELKALAVFKTALTDEQLTALTTI